MLSLHNRVLALLTKLQPKADTFVLAIILVMHKVHNCNSVGGTFLSSVHLVLSPLCSKRQKYLMFQPISQPPPFSSMYMMDLL
jgi:hypothetical protein